MSRIKLIVISVAIVCVLAGVPHLIASNQDNKLIDRPSSSIDVLSSLKNRVYTKTKITNDDLSPLVGKWKVVWDTKDMKASAIYHLKQEGHMIRGYSIKLVDEYGQSMDDNTFVFELKTFKYPQGQGIYKLGYEDEVYDVSCQIKLVNPIQLEIRYTYQGYNDIEIWNKID